ncbi:PTS ascorbate transporter subunit IIA [Suicoccus acidiformans]|uniref:Ascorbate-specific PTS system EIIA component n=1 Tax=Suicoccus acidiformans TaxID=2036206 RepID=A0A347WIG2_9LACT|nr:PTS sugar transporter subunit IIA [Suicoccus acidiformans]AXY24869.1 PTS ascorbate transporter subunit IIA [Suicoccus acidiformans]
MLKYFYENNLINFVPTQPDNWEDAVRQSCSVLIDKGYITEEYAGEIVNNVKEHGPYIVIADQIAMPHASTDSPGVLGTGVSFTKFPSEVTFVDQETNEEKPATLFFTLAAKNPDEHLENITNLMELLMDEEVVEKLIEIDSIAEYEELMKSE